MKTCPTPLSFQGLRPLAMGLSLALLALGAQASGYRFGTQSAAAEGTANSNGAEGADASSLFANPAALTRLKGLQVSGVLDIIDPKVRFTDAGSTLTAPGTGLQPRAISAAGDTSSPADTAYVPHMYLSYALSDRMVAGMGVFVPFGAKLDYGMTWGGRYNLGNVELKSISLNPNLAFKISDNLSVAGGLNLQHMEGKLKRAVPYSSAYARGLLAAAAQVEAGGSPALALQMRQMAAQIFGDPQYDGSVAIEGKDWGFGFNLALLWDLDKNTRFGMSYRSAVKQVLKGTGDWTQPTTLPASVLAAITAAPYNGLSALDHNDSAASVAIKTPESLSIHGFHQLTPTVAVMADATWVKQSRLETLRIDFHNTTPDSITPEHWKNTWRVSAGVNWQAGKDVMLRAGFANDRSPVPSRTRSPSLPDAHRQTFALGANLNLAPATTLDLALTYLKVKDAAMDIVDDAEGETPCNCSLAHVRGNYASRAVIFGMQINHKF
ncbi:long-chain fatty acid transport protein [Inhella inkyongensis]|uniref:Long-chain fatty acid transport protein n=1 Tax=Inhella inkyongensis TaxID=392593 RepID=A0A840RZD1_9BURK|nr:outer membrane protein transport protein [Inhella inkyongensis]MBB5202913.1 long-chain fatty acid transport protein [Inhella inkyongensis]